MQREREREADLDRNLLCSVERPLVQIKIYVDIQ